MIKKKVCMVGAFAVGKTSLVRRYVSGIYDEKYLTTIGVKIDKKEVDVDGQQIQLLLWDIEGEDEFTRIRTSYLKGASALFLVVDGTRHDTLEIALSIKRVADESARRPYPCIVLFNKTDLSSQWEITEDEIAAVEASGFQVLRTSCKDGNGVEEAFSIASRLMLNQ
jgi:small GTP-binding protein